MELTNEMRESAMQAKSAEEIYAEHNKEGEISDEGLEDVVGGKAPVAKGVNTIKCVKCDASLMYKSSSHDNYFFECSNCHTKYRKFHREGSPIRWHMTY